MYSVRISRCKNTYEARSTINYVLKLLKVNLPVCLIGVYNIIFSLNSSLYISDIMNRTARIYIVSQDIRNTNV